jgi:hypothetical protein
MDRALFDRAVRGKANLNAAVLRGLLSAEGNIHLLVLVQRLLPGPPRASTTTVQEGRSQ